MNFFFKRSLSLEPLVLIAAPDRPLSGHDLAALAAQRFVATEVGCIYRHLFDQAFAEAGLVAPQLAAEVDSMATIVRLVAAGAGLALVPRLAIADMLDSGKLVEIPWPAPNRTASLVAIWRRRRTQPPALRQFVAVAEAAAMPLRSGDARLPRAISSLS